MADDCALLMIAASETDSNLYYATRFIAPRSVCIHGGERGAADGDERSGDGSRQKPGHGRSSRLLQRGRADGSRPRRRNPRNDRHRARCPPTVGDQTADGASRISLMPMPFASSSSDINWRRKKGPSSATAPSRQRKRSVTWNRRSAQPSKPSPPPTRPSDARETRNGLICARTANR